MKKSTRSQRSNYKKRRNSFRKIRSMVLGLLWAGNGTLITLLAIFALVYYSMVKLNPVVEAAAVKTNQLLGRAGFIVENVYVEGQSHVSNEEIIDALGVKLGQPIFSYSPTILKSNLETVGWIKHATVERQLPSSFFIGILERKPIALWQNAGKLYLIDEEGNIITSNGLKEFSRLPILIGDDAPLYANALLTIISKDSDLFSKVSSAIRVGERRWNIRLQGNLEIKLPEKDVEKQWNYIIKLYKEGHLFDKNVTQVDLRVTDKLYIRNNNETD